MAKEKVEAGEGTCAGTSTHSIPPVAREELLACARVLEALVTNRGLLASLDTEERKQLLTAAGRVSRPAWQDERVLLRAFRKKERKQKRDADRAVVASATIRVQRKAPVLLAAPNPVIDSQAPPEKPPELVNPRNCYICKAPYTQVHFFYDSMCGACAELNFAKRNQTADLRGRVAVITGARVKIGMQISLMMLRAGCAVVATTRFPRDAAVRYSREKDFGDFKDRLQIYGLDLRHTPSVEIFARHLEKTLSRLDFIINNACQTVRRPPGWYAHMLETETAAQSAVPEELRHLLRGQMELSDMLLGHAAVTAEGTQALAPVTSVLGTWQSGKPGMGLWGSAQLSQMPYSRADASLADDVFPRGRMDADLQQVDLREMNSWRLKLADVPIPELLEVQLVNAVAPFVLNGKLRPLMARDRTGDKHVVNVSAMEGQFNRGTKTDRHPHTNMAKAALNMMTRTSAQDYVKDGIHMNSVDTGWVTDEDPLNISERKQRDYDFSPPLDIVDGAARVVDPIFHGFNTGEHTFGKFLKDYKPVEW